MRWRLFTLAIGVLCGGLLLAADAHARHPGESHTDTWRTGDVVFLDGVSLRSRAVRLFEMYSTDFSHVGMVAMEDGVPFVVHADPGRGRVVRERWDALLATGQFTGAALYRVRGIEPSTAVAAAAFAQGYARQGIPFDFDFDLKTPERLYCTELVWRAYRSAGLDLAPDVEIVHPYLLPAHLLEFTGLEQMLQF